MKQLTPEDTAELIALSEEEKAIYAKYSDDIETLDVLKISEQDLKRLSEMSSRGYFVMFGETIEKSVAKKAKEYYLQITGIPFDQPISNLLLEAILQIIKVKKNIAVKGQDYEEAAYIRDLEKKITERIKAQL
jgi:protein-arginine kinase activator protein McsA